MHLSVGMYPSHDEGGGYTVVCVGDGRGERRLEHHGVSEGYGVVLGFQLEVEGPEELQRGPEDVVLRAGSGVVAKRLMALGCRLVVVLGPAKPATIVLEVVLGGVVAVAGHGANGEGVEHLGDQRRVGGQRLDHGLHFILSSHLSLTASLALDVSQTEFEK